MSSISTYKTYLPVVSACAVNDHEIEVQFLDGSKGRLDMSPLMRRHPWQRLSNPEFFRLAHAAYDTIVWTDDVDLAPEYVWEHATRIG